MSLQDGPFHGTHSGRNRRTGRFTARNRVYKARLDRIAEKLNALRQTYDATSPGDMALLATAALHLADAEVARSRLSRTRATNSALRVLRHVHRKPAPPPPTLAEMLADDEAEHA
jgi:hypothetical protein